MEMNKISIGIGGEAGSGIMESGNLIAKFALTNGLYSFVASEYPSLIRGGHNFSLVNISPQEVHSLSRGIDLLIALNEETVKLHWGELHKGSAIIYDSDAFKLDESNEDIIFHGIPLTSIAKETGGAPIVRNTVAVGAAIGLIQGEFSVLENILKATFAKKGDDVISTNINAAIKGCRYILGQRVHQFNYKLDAQTPDPEKILINGNDAICIGAIRAGLKFACIYPMTPITSLLDYFAAKQNDYNLVVKEPEDEISAMVMAVGASFAGARSLTATSGGGFCLMTEAVGMAGMSETPIVVIEGMRSGPSSAMATKTEQSDLNFVLNPGHGEFPRIVLAPGDPTECLRETFTAFNLADKYQLPVIVMTDKYLSSSYSVMEKPNTLHWSIDRGKFADPANDNYKRYAYSESGVSPRTLPGTKGMIQHSSSYEHDEAGHDSDDPIERDKMMEKRQKKLLTLAEELPEPILYGDKDADITLFGWGSTKGVILDAIKLLADEGIKANFLHLLYVLPFPSQTVAEAFDNAPEKLMVENNYTGQMAHYVTTNTGRRFKHKLLKFDGTPFYPEEIVDKVKQIMKKAKPAEKHIEKPAEHPKPRPESHQHEANAHAVHVHPTTGVKHDGK